MPSARSQLPAWLTAVANLRPDLEREDVMSEVLLAVLASAACAGRDARGFPEGPFAFLRARWALCDLARRMARRGRREAVTSPEALPDLAAPTVEPEGRVASDARRRGVLARLAALPVADRHLVALKLGAGLAERDVAEVLAMAPSTVHRRWAAIRHRLVANV